MNVKNKGKNKNKKQKQNIGDKWKITYTTLYLLPFFIKQIL